MQEIIIHKISTKFGQPYKVDSFSNFVKIQYRKDNIYLLSFEVSENGVQLFLNETGPIIGDSALNDVQDLEELMKEIFVVLSYPIKETTYLVGKEVRKTRFTYKALVNNEIVSLSYTGGRYSWKDLFAKKVIKEAIYDAWLG